MSREFTITQNSASEKVSVLRVTGRLDAKNAQTLFGRSRGALADGQTQLLINLADVSFVASSGIGTLLALTEEFRDVGGCVHFVALSDAVRSVVDLLNLSQFLTIGSSESEVLEAIGV
jgi:anti-anti-sigma factor